MVLLILAVVWAIVLIPPALRGRSESRPADSISHFRRQLHTLQQSGPRRSRSPMSAHAALGSLRPVSGTRPRTSSRRAASPAAATLAASRAQKRRRDIFIGLLAAMGISLVLGIIPNMRVLLVVHLLADVLFVGYVALLVRMRAEAAEREMKVRFLPSAGPQIEPALLSRRIAN